MMMILRSSVLLLLSAALLPVGCTNERDVSREAIEKMVGEELKETVPVSGVVSIGGVPTAKVDVFAYTEKSGMKPAAQTRTGPDGTYSWTTYLPGDGLVPGEYRLAFAHVPKEGKGKKAGKDLLQGKYRNPIQNDFPLVVELGAPQTEVNYNLE